MSAAGFEQLPIEIFKVVVKDLPLDQRLRLRKVSKPIRQATDTQKVDLSVICLQVTDDAAILGFDGHRITYSTTKHGECEIETPNSIKRFEREIPSRLATNDAVAVLSISRKIEKFQIVSHRFTDAIVALLPKGMQALEAVINVSRIGEFLGILNKMDYDHLQTVTVTCENGRGFRQIFDTLYFKKASSWHMFGLPAIEVEDLQKFLHFKEFSAKLGSINSQVVLQIIEMMITVDTLKKCQLRSDEDIAVEEVGRTLGEQVEDDFVHHEFHIQQFEYTEALQLTTDESKSLRPVLYRNRALARLRRDDFEGAQSDCNKALKFDSAGVNALFRRALAREQLGNVGPAFNDAKEALRLSPQDKGIAEILQRLVKANNDKIKQTTSLANKVTDMEKKFRGEAKDVAQKQTALNNLLVLCRESEPGATSVWNQVRKADGIEQLTGTLKGVGARSYFSLESEFQYPFEMGGAKQKVSIKDRTDAAGNIDGVS